MSERLFVTGASGFIGQHVLFCLQQRGVPVAALTRQRARLSDASRSVLIIEGDLAGDPKVLFELAGRPQRMLHLAWDGLPNYRSLHHFETELPRQYAFLKGLIGAGVTSLTVSGTCFEYGMQSGALAEHMPPRPSNPYGFAKAALYDQLCYLKGAQNFNLNWARLFYTFGAGQPATSLYPQIQAAVKRGDTVFRMSGGEQLRDFLPVEALAGRLVELALRGRDTGVVNVCSGRPQSVRALVESWIAANSWTISPERGYYPYPDYEPMAFWGDNSKYHSLISQA